MLSIACLESKELSSLLIIYIDFLPDRLKYSFYSDMAYENSYEIGPLLIFFADNILFLIISCSSNFYLS